MADLKAELHRARHLVDVLPARPGSADEAFVDLALVENEPFGDRDHQRSSLSRSGAEWTTGKARYSGAHGTKSRIADQSAEGSVRSNSSARPSSSSAMSPRRSESAVR